MCWNEHVSLNTFLFSSFVLLLIIYNNEYTKYKIQELNNPYIYIFLASFIFMQLIEFFIWRNINNSVYNNIFSIFGILLIFFMQPLASLMILKNIQLRNLLIMIYLSFAIPFSIYKFSTTHIHSVLSKRGHLNWKFFGPDPFIFLFWLFFLLFIFFYEKIWVGIIFGVLSLVVVAINFMNDGSAGSIWCWSVNSIMIYYAFYLLLYLPFLEKRLIN
uniref:Uncharacterized protein n=1 Tax=viral metagenome TaxID=1070528 RepID=A0A6C0E028_9ZZZZ